MPQENRRLLILVLTLLISLSGCDTNRQSSRSSLFDNDRFMDLWNTYTRCSQDEDPDAMRADAQRLSREANTIDSDAAYILLERHEPFHAGRTVRLSIDLAAMAAACAIHAGQVAEEMGRLYVAREMFSMVVLHLSQPRYHYYTAQARLGLKRLDVVRHVCRKLPHLVMRCQHDI
jgi:hypothetical protein